MESANTKNTWFESAGRGQRRAVDGERRAVRVGDNRKVVFFCERAGQISVFRARIEQNENRMAVQLALVHTAKIIGKGVCTHYVLEWSDSDSEAEAEAEGETGSDETTATDGRREPLLLKLPLGRRGHARRTWPIFLQ